ncbi:MAG: Unknown protein [uncultured Sulfurovum sp.]|uniref:Serine/threonine protein kinase n=1 Tax=uncultured Sulfurovum sp. TaxID=269237 RepID=A0A6S6TI20_9BACT|nr:MAG: Unknown protein [uncultured Sulfurovum sp.]
MDKNHHLPIGHKLGGHYEIVQVLTEDEYEILYLVKDLHMGGQNVVLKELFLLAYTSRDDDNSVRVMAKSKQLFEETKKDVIHEIEVLKSNHLSTAAKVYGYFEENNTVYTIMEFINSSNFSVYLEANAKDAKDSKLEVSENSIEEKEQQEEIKEKPKSKIFLKLLLVSVVFLLGLAYYAYDMIQKDKEKAKNKSSTVTVVNEPINNLPLEDKVKEEEQLPSVLEVKEEVKKEKPEGASYIEEGDIPIAPVEALPEPPKEEVYEDTDASNDLEELIYTQEEQPVIQPPIIYEPSIEEVPSRQTPDLSLGTRIN